FRALSRAHNLLEAMIRNRVRFYNHDDDSICWNQSGAFSFVKTPIFPSFFREEVSMLTISRWLGRQKPIRPIRNLTSNRPRRLYRRLRLSPALGKHHTAESSAPPSSSEYILLELALCSAFHAHNSPVTSRLILLR